MTGEKQSVPDLPDPPKVGRSHDTKFIADLEGIGPSPGSKLRAAGVKTTEELLVRGARRDGRAALAEITGLGGHQILAWVNHADLMRIEGIGSMYSDLLEAAGVDSVTDLARRKPASLAAKLREVVAARPDIVRRVPSEEEIADWIEQAQGLPNVVER